MLFKQVAVLPARTSKQALKVQYKTTRTGHGIRAWHSCLSQTMEMIFLIHPAFSECGLLGGAPQSLIVSYQMPKCIKTDITSGSIPSFETVKNKRIFNLWEHLPVTANGHGADGETLSISCPLRSLYPQQPNLFRGFSGNAIWEAEQKL